MSNNTHTVIVTGASMGLGYAIAEAFLEDCSNVVINGSDAVRLQAAEKRLSAIGRVASVVGSVDDTSTGARLAETALAAFGRADVLVNNAGIFSPKPFLDVDEADLDSFLGVNLKGTYFTAQAVIPIMQRQGGGSIINIGTVLTQHGLAGFPATAAVASKGAVHALTIQLAAEFAADNIRVNTIAPGVIRTPIHARNGIEDVDSLAGLHLLNRVGEAAHIAEAVLHLAKADFTTGLTYNLDGGHVAGHMLG
jgi:NAD(P)-dependent dehydrogenase (short-subunit alcohol dehydrogenase family)